MKPIYLSLMLLLVVGCKNILKEQPIDSKPQPACQTQPTVAPQIQDTIPLAVAPIPESKQPAEAESNLTKETVDESPIVNTPSVSEVVAVSPEPTINPLVTIEPIVQPSPITQPTVPELATPVMLTILILCLFGMFVGRILNVKKQES